MKTIEEQNTDFAWDFCIDHEIASEQELDLVTKLNGFNWESIWMSSTSARATGTSSSMSSVKGMKND